MTQQTPQQRYSSAPAPIHRGVSAPIQPHAYGNIPPLSHREASVDNVRIKILTFFKFIFLNIKILI